MTFDHPWLLLALLLPVGWAAWEWRESARRLALVLKAATFVCIVLALRGPRIVVYQTKVAVAVLADTSASVSPRGSGARIGACQRGGARARPSLDAHHPLRAHHSRGRGSKSRPRTAGNCVTPRATAGHGTNLESCHSRWRRVAARRHGAAPAAGVRRQ